MIWITLVTRFATHINNENLQKQKKKNLYHAFIYITHVSSISTIKFFTDLCSTYGAKYLLH
jgi:hydrogenase maturation factor